MVNQLLCIVLLALLFVFCSVCHSASISTDERSSLMALCANSPSNPICRGNLDAIFVDGVPNKRKNEFIRFGKRSGLDLDVLDHPQVATAAEKRKNEFIRFGRDFPGEDSDEKRKNEFIRFGKRKNEFIRFG